MLQRLRNLDYLVLTLWVIRIAIIIVIVWGTVASLLDKENPFSAHDLVDYLVVGVAQGSLYALIALGYTLVYGVLLMINFAHGEFFMTGTMTATVFVAAPLSASGFLDRHPVLGLLAIGLTAMVVSVGIALLTERIAYRPLRKAPRLIPLITAIGASFFWQYFFMGLYGGQVVPFPEIEPLMGKWSFFGIITSLKPASIAACTFAVTPPTGSTSPLTLKLPVIESDCLTGIFSKAEITALETDTLALSPSTPE